MLNFILIALAVLAGGLLIAAALRPNIFRVQRSATINAPPETIIALIDDFHAWGRWSPYEKLDPAMTRTFEGAARGVGAIYGWSGNGKAGEGRMEIVEVTATKVLIKLDFLKPFSAHNTATFTVEPQGAASRVTWAMEGENPYIAKLMGLILNMDRMVGGAFETGLGNLKTAAEG